MVTPCIVFAASEPPGPCALLAGTFGEFRPRVTRSISVPKLDKRPVLLALVLANVVVIVVAAAWAHDASQHGITCMDEEGSRPVSVGAIVTLAGAVGLPYALLVGSLLGVLAALVERGRIIVIVGWRWR